MPAEMCRNCGEVSDAVAAMGGVHKPKPGDRALCIHCGTATVFDDQLRRVTPDAATLLELDRDPEVIALRRRIVLINRRFGDAKPEGGNA